MKATYKVGELVILQNAGYFHEYNGSLAVIISGYCPGTAMDMNTMRRVRRWTYAVQMVATPCGRLPDRTDFLVEPHQIRRIPPAAEKGEAGASTSKLPEGGLDLPGMTDRREDGNA